MQLQYEIRDTNNPGDRGMRFSSLPRALKELRQCVGTPGRWQVVDRSSGMVMEVSK